MSDSYYISLIQVSDATVLMLTVLQNMRAGERKWKGPRLGLVFILFLMNCAYFTLFLFTNRTLERS